MTNQIAIISPKVSIHDGKAITTTEDVAIYFGKQHHHVVQKLESLDCSKEFTIRNFSRMVKNKPIGSGAEREVVYYEMTKDGFVFLVMGFTGKKAAAFKEAYISEFNRMEAELGKNIQPPVEAPTMYTLTLSDEEFCSLCYLWSLSDKISSDAKEMYPALHELGSKFAGRIYDIAYESRYTLNNARKALSRETQRLQPQIRLNPNWRRILPHLSQTKH